MTVEFFSLLLVECDLILLSYPLAYGFDFLFGQLHMLYVLVSHLNANTK